MTRLLSIAGTDPTGGAGLTADLQVFRDFGCQGLGVATAVLDQDSATIHAQLALDGPSIGQTAARILLGGQPAAIKVGLLHTPDVAEAVAMALHGSRIPLVLDPVLASGRGDSLARDGLLDVLRRAWLPKLTTVLTPNVPEAESLLGNRIPDGGAASEAAHALVAMGPTAVLLKGGHLPNAPGDWLATASGIRFLPRERAFPGDIHGTGCHLSSALAALLGLGWGLDDAVVGARRYLVACAELTEPLPGEVGGRLLIVHGDATRQAARDLLAGTAVDC